MKNETNVCTIALAMSYTSKLHVHTKVVKDQNGMRTKHPTHFGLLINTVDTLLNNRMQIDHIGNDYSSRNMCPFLCIPITANQIKSIIERAKSASFMSLC